MSRALASQPLSGNNEAVTQGRKIVERRWATKRAEKEE